MAAVQDKLPTGPDLVVSMLDTDVVDAGECAGTEVEAVLQSQRDGSVSQGHH